MEVKHLLIDCNNIGHIAAHSMPNHLSSFEKPTAVLFGFLSAVLKLQEKFKADDMHFCWDSRQSYRKLVYPGYKEKRHTKDKTEEEIEDQRVMYNQFTELRKDILPNMGFTNVHMKTGFEGDDIMAVIVNKYKLPKETCVVVSTDHDLFQLISSIVTVYNPITEVVMKPESFKDKYDITPNKWALTKAISGCSSDEIVGVQGVGEKTAIKYINGTLPSHYAAFKRMESNEGQIIRRKNMRLVDLPFKKDKLKIEIKPQHELYAEDFRNVFSELGFETFLRDFFKWERAFNLQESDIGF